MILPPTNTDLPAGSMGDATAVLFLLLQFSQKASNTCNRSVHAFLWCFKSKADIPLLRSQVRVLSFLPFLPYPLCFRVLEVKWAASANPFHTRRATDLLAYFALT